MIANRSTYVRKIADGKYEFGWSFLSINYRKKNPYQPVGTKPTLVEAEAERERLAEMKEKD